PSAGGGQGPTADRLGPARGIDGDRDRKDGQSPKGTRGEGPRIGDPRSGSRGESDSVPGDGGHARGGTPDLAGDPRIPTGVTQGAAGNVRTGERLPARSVGGPRDAPRAPRDRCERPGGKGSPGCRVGRAERRRSHAPRESCPGSVPVRLVAEGGSGTLEERSRAASPRKRFKRPGPPGRNRTPCDGTLEADGCLDSPPDGDRRATP